MGRVDRQGGTSEEAEESFLSIVIPTFNERDNLEVLLEKLDSVLVGEQREYIFVDDQSPDGTAAHARLLARSREGIRIIERWGQRGLAGACVAGVQAATGNLVLIMDADLQHDESAIPRMLQAVRCGGYDVAYGSRFGEDAELEGLTAGRRRLSQAANWMAGLVAGQPLADPMSGFFLFRRRDFAAAHPRLAKVGYKIFLDFLCSSPRRLEVKEVGIRFRERNAGESKLDLVVFWEFALLLLSKFTRGLIPVSFISFAVVGLSGVAVHMAAVIPLLKSGLCTYVMAQSIATGIAMFSNYVLNNMLTYAGQRKSGWREFTVGLLLFMLISSFGAVINVLIANELRLGYTHWLVASLVGTVISAVWNYSISRLAVWNR